MESDKFLSGIKPATPLSSRILTPTALPGQLPASKWFQTSVNSGKSSWPQNGHCQALPPSPLRSGAALSNSSPEIREKYKKKKNQEIFPKNIFRNFFLYILITLFFQIFSDVFLDFFLRFFSRIFQNFPSDFFSISFIIYNFFSKSKDLKKFIRYLFRIFIRFFLEFFLELFKNDFSEISVFDKKLP